jgi:hypothetical protein
LSSLRIAARIQSLPFPNAPPPSDVSSTTFDLPRRAGSASAARTNESIDEQRKQVRPKRQALSATANHSPKRDHLLMRFHGFAHDKIVAAETGLRALDVGLAPGCLVYTTASRQT